MDRKTSQGRRPADFTSNYNSYDRESPSFLTQNFHGDVQGGGRKKIEIMVVKLVLSNDKTPIITGWGDETISELKVKAPKYTRRIFRQVRVPGHYEE